MVFVFGLLRTCNIYVLFFCKIILFYGCRPHSGCGFIRIFFCAITITRLMLCLPIILGSIWHSRYSLNHWNLWKYTYGTVYSLYPSPPIAHIPKAIIPIRHEAKDWYYHQSKQNLKHHKTHHYSPLLPFLYLTIIFISRTLTFNHEDCLDNKTLCSIHQHINDWKVKQMGPLLCIRNIYQNNGSLNVYAAI